ncbi:hypothetical protein BDN72DRAFT_511704 [Pluteus cervinus]|uniref:Uncharacterized protein n=1 Tax=Pluteus cervinus TaxID=181527 RepID=A0ACD3BCG4_9AGAR|nr:hypothetical protein BDN72DRAFT_511704 [Pluteus cervinus]
MPRSSKDVKPFALGDTLRDLALLRASDVDLSTLVPPNADLTSSVNEVENAVGGSYDFVREARAAIKIHNRGETDTQGKRVEELRSRLEEVQDGIGSKRGHEDEMSL